MNRKFPKGSKVITQKEIIDWILDQQIVNTKPDYETLVGTPYPSIECEVDHDYVENVIITLDDIKEGTIREQLEELKKTATVEPGKKKLVTIFIRFIY